MNRVGQNRIHTPYITVSLENFLPKVPIYTVYMWFWPALDMKRDAARHSTTQHDVLASYLHGLCLQPEAQVHRIYSGTAPRITVQTHTYTHEKGRSVLRLLHMVRYTW